MQLKLKSTLGAISGVAGVVLLSRLLGFARELVIADRFGTSALYDVYLLGIMLSALVYGVYNFALFYLLVPFLSKRLEEEERGNKSTFLWQTATSVAFFSITLSGLLAIFAPYLLKPWLTGLTYVEQSIAEYYSRLTAIVVLFGAGEALLRAYLNVRKVHAYPALGYVVYNIVFISIVLLFSSTHTIGAIAYGWIFGLASQNLLLLILVRRFAPGMRFNMFLRREDVRHLFFTGVWLVAVESCRGIYFLIDRYFAVGFGKGVVSALNYSQVLIQLPESIVGFAIGAVAFPIMSHYATGGNSERFATVYEKTVSGAWFLAVPMATFMFVNAKPMVEILFKRGQFDSHSVMLTSAMIQPYIFTALALFVIGVSLRACYSRNWGKTVLVVTVSLLGLKVLTTTLFSKWFGYVGITTATSVSQLAYAIILVTVVSKRVKEVNSRLLASNAIRGGLAGCFAGICGYYSLNFIMADHVVVSRLETIISMLVSGITIIAVYVAIAWMMKFNKYMPGRMTNA